MCFWLLAAASAGVRAEAPKMAQIDLLQQSDIRYDVDAEGRLMMTFAGRAKILEKRVLSGMRTAGLSYSHSIQEAEILEAYTLKADGRRIDVPDKNFQTSTQGGRDGGHPLFSDRESRSVIFPELEVGDTVVFSYRIRDKEAIFSGKASFSHAYSPFTAHEESVFTVRAPADFPLTIAASQLEELPAKMENGWIVRRWRYQNPRPPAWDRARDDGIWRYGETPSIYVSNFSSYEAIAAAYGERALPKAVPDARIRKLAAEIVQGAQSRREEAQKLYEWVSTNITYAGNYIGVGSVVPRDLDVVLDNRMGDCKDHTTLLQALLAAREIASEQVLVNAGDTYDLPEVPSVWAVNHVMNYLPEWQLYVDATAKEMPFGYLPKGAYGKPVIHVGVPDGVRTLTSNPDVVTAAQEIDTNMEIAADGSASGKVTVRLEGAKAAEVRNYFMRMKPEDRQKFVERRLGRQGSRASGTLELNDLSPEKRLSNSYAFGMTFKVENYLRQRSGAFTLSPLISMGMALEDLEDFDDSKTLARDQACWDAHVKERYVIALAPGVSFTGLPEPLTRRNQYLDFVSRIDAHPDGVTIERSFVDKTPVGVCKADFWNAWVREVAVVAENLEQPVFYRRERPRAR
ncbi:MAG: DUF3857 domain-containing protein [Zoogloeaceae bacterium]|nr:DUF3857 domain-containing protein [Zoogloeaceae bacterium]